jgi:hypothetical protein
MPGLTDLLTGVFGLGQTAWFVWLGIVLLRSNPDPVAYQNTTEQQLFGSKA